ncbi:putative ribonuclease H-like domain-containing protein [Tanacetum coccineum]
MYSPSSTLQSFTGSPKRSNSRDPKSDSFNKRKDPRGFFTSAQQALVFRNKRDERSIVVKKKAWLVEQGFRQEEGIDYDEVFAPVARIDAIRLFFAFGSYMGFTVYQMDVKSVFVYGTIEEEVYVHQPLGFVDPAHPNKVYKVIKALYGLHQAPRAWYKTLSSILIENGFRRVKQQPDGIFISQDKYVADILKKFDFLSIRTTTTLIESNKPLVKDEDGIDVDVTPKASHLNVVKRIFRYLKHQPKLGLWYPKDLPFELEAYSDSDYAGASLDRKSTTGGCQFLGRRLISWQCKKQTIVANSTTETEYVAAANCCGQVLWIENQMMDYGFNFMNTKIRIDNESTISVIKNPVAHARTKHIESYGQMTWTFRGLNTCEIYGTTLGKNNRQFDQSLTVLALTSLQLGNIISSRTSSHSWSRYLVTLLSKLLSIYRASDHELSVMAIKSLGYVPDSDPEEDPEEDSEEEHADYPADGGDGDDEPFGDDTDDDDARMIMYEERFRDYEDDEDEDGT